jgi:protein TonB
MERPIAYATPSGGLGRNHLGSATLTVAIHALAIFGLLAALNQRAVVKTLQLIEVAIDAPIETPSSPPPPPPALIKPTPPVAIVPEFAVQRPAVPPPSITTVPPVVAAPAPVRPPAPVVTHAVPDKPLRAIMSTHLSPPYPAIAKRLNEQGTTLMEVAIDPHGKAAHCTIVTSSSSARLDDAGCDFVKSHWRWQPPTLDGKPVAAKTRVSIKWDLRDAD